MLILFLFRRGREGKGLSCTTVLSLFICCSVSAVAAVVLLFPTFVCNIHIVNGCVFIRLYWTRLTVLCFPLSFIKLISVLPYFSRIWSHIRLLVYIRLLLYMKINNFPMYHGRLSTKDKKEVEFFWREMCRLQPLCRVQQACNTIRIKRGTDSFGNNDWNWRSFFVESEKDGWSRSANRNERLA